MKKLLYTICYIFAYTLILTISLTAHAQQLQTIRISPETPSKTGELIAPKIQPLHLPAKTKQQIEEISQPSESDQPSSTPKLVVEQVDKSSEIEQFMAGIVPETISMSIKQFGYDLFGNTASSFAPSNKVPVGPGYVIGPGDEIRVTLWGKIEGMWNVVVDRDGAITLPKIGVLGVTGLTFNDLKNLLHKELSKYYKGFEMNVSMGALRSIRIYVVGNALKPGSYTISSLSTLVNALFESGGPSKTGTMRDIQLKRNGQTIRHLDMYDFLLKGDKTDDMRLMPEDIIFIPPVGPLAGIAGQVTTPAVYELKGETRITDLIALAGGITATGYLRKIQVERIYNNEVKILVDTSLEKLDKGEEFLLQDRDVIKIFPISNVITNAVSLKGNVTRSGQYQWVKGMKVSDILKEPSKDLLPETYYSHALIDRYIPPDYHKEIISFNLGKALFEKDEKEDKVLMPYDVLTVYSRWEFKEKPVVKIAGAVNKPGEYDLKRNMNLTDLINLAGGIKRYALKKEAELTRVHITQEGPMIKIITVNLEAALKKSSKSDIPLKVDDYLFVRTVPEWRLYQTVTISGEVKYPGAYTIKKGDKLSSLIERAGGYTDKAYLRGSFFTRNSVRELQQQSLMEMVQRLEKELITEGSVQASITTSSEELESKKAVFEQKKQFIESLRQLKATGRLSIVLAHLRLLKNSKYDIELEQGDSLYIPMKNSIVNVVGAVMSRGSFIYSDHLNYNDYVGMTGGYSRYADEDRVYVLKVDGSARKLSKGFFNWNTSKSRWEIEGFGEEIKEIEPGDTIVVPEQLERIAWMREIKDITQILYQIATTAGILIVAF